MTRTVPLLAVISVLVPARALAPTHAASTTITWVDALSLGVGGRGFPDLQNGSLTYGRFPLGAQADLSPGEWLYGQDSAGLFVQFSSDATSVHLNYTLRNAFPPYTTPFATLSPMAASGADLYAFDGTSGTWRWVASSFNGLEPPSGRTVVVESPLFSNGTGWPVPPMPAAPTWPGVTRYRLHFPSYNGVLSMAVGVPAGATLSADLSWNATAPVLYLGTSIAQGGDTGRPGQSHVARLSSTLPRTVLNYGLCGACALEQGLAKWVTAMQRVPAVLVLDCTANMDAASVRGNTPPFVAAVRAAWGEEVPIVLVEPVDDSPSWIQGDTTYNRPALRAALRDVYDSLVAGGDTAVHYVNSTALRAGADDDYEELTYEGVHLTDRGHALHAAALRSVLSPLLASAPADRPTRVSCASTAVTWPDVAGRRNSGPTPGAPPPPPPPPLTTSPGPTRASSP